MRVKVLLYGVVWLLCLSPFTIFLTLGRLSSKMYPSFVEMVGILAGSYFYYEVIWIPVRRLFGKEDLEFCKIMNWR